MKAIVIGVTAVCSLLLAAVPTQAAINLVANPGFESGDFSGWTEFGATSFQGVDSSIFVRHSGTYGASFFSTGEVSGISQEIDTIPGTEYTLSFWLQNDGDGPNIFDVLWDGGTVTSLPNWAAFSYTEYVFTVIGSPGQTTELRFVFQHEPAFWDLDDVSVVDPNAVAAVPEPASLMVWSSLSLLALGSAYRRRRRQLKNGN